MYNGGWTEASMKEFSWELGDTARGQKVIDFYEHCLEIIKNGKAIYLTNGFQGENGFVTYRVYNKDLYLYNGFYTYKFADGRGIVGGEVVVTATEV